MIVTAIFILILLIGISLFIAVVGTAILKRYSTRVGKPREIPVNKSEFKNHYKRKYEESVSAIPEKVQKTPVYIPSTEREFVYKKPKESHAEGKWFFITFVVLIVVIFSFYFGIKGYQNLIMKPKLFFCENVDYVKLKPINKSNTFTRGNVTIFIKSHRPLEQDKARVDIFSIDHQGLNHYATKELPLKPDWTSFSFKVLFDKIGTYTVMVYDMNDRLLNQENIYIVPDSYAYKPVSK